MEVAEFQIATESQADTTSLDCCRGPCAGGHRYYLSLAVFLKKVDALAGRQEVATRQDLPQQYSRCQLRCPRFCCVLPLVITCELLPFVQSYANLTC